MEEAFSCSFCKKRLSDSIKLIPECGHCICGECYDILCKQIDEEWTQLYKCTSCDEIRLMPQNGLPNNRNLLMLLQSSREKPMHENENAKILKYKLSELDEQMKKLQSFNGRQVIQLYCKQVELEVNESIESAIKQLRKIQESCMKQIGEYRERCLANLSNSHLHDSTRRELTVLSREVNQFKARWNDYLIRTRAYETETDIEAALLQTALFISKMESIEERMKKMALNWQTLVFKENLKQFLNEWNHAGEIELISESKTPFFTLSSHSDWVRQVLFLPDGRLASCSCDKTIKIWDVKSETELFELTGHSNPLYSLALLPNGHSASGSFDKTIKIWDFKHAREIRTIQAHSAAVVSLRVLKNGNLASYSHDGTIKIWNLSLKEDEPVSIMIGHGNNYWMLQLIGVLSNSYLMTCSRHEDHQEECILRLWNPNKPNPVKLVPTNFNDASSLLVLSNDQVALGCNSGTLKIININDQASSRTKERAHDEDVYSLAQLSNGNLISGGNDDSNWTIKVWNLIDWRLLQTINTGHSNWIKSMSVSSDERILASGSDDRTIKLWPISS